MSYTTAAALKAYLAITSGDEDSLLATFIEAAQAFVESPAGAGRLFEAEADTARTFDAWRDVEGRTLWLREDLAQIATITNGDGQAIPPSAYVTEPRREGPYYAIRLLGSSGLAWTYEDDPEDAITVTGRWAYAVTPPADIVHATLRLAAWMYRQKDSGMDSDRPLFVADGVTVMPAAIPRDVMTILHGYRRLV